MDIIKEQFKASDIELFLTSGGPEDVLAADITYDYSYNNSIGSLLQATIDSQPKNLGGHTVTFNLRGSSGSFNNKIVFKDFYNGTIILHSDAKYSGLDGTKSGALNFQNVNENGIEIINTHCNMIFRDLNIRYSGYGIGLYFESAMGDNFIDASNIIGNNYTNGASGVRATGCSVRVTDAMFGSLGTAIYCDNGFIHVTNCWRYHVAYKNTTSVAAVRGGVISKNGSIPAAMSDYDYLYTIYTASGGVYR